MNVSYMNRIKMVDSSIKYYDMEKQSVQQDRDVIYQRLASIVEDVTHSRVRTLKSDRMADVLSWIGRATYQREIGDYDRKFCVEDSCTGC